MRLFWFLCIILITPVLATTSINDQLIVKPHDSTARSVPINAVAFPMLRLEIAAKSDPQRITSITVRQTGLSSRDDVDSVYARVNGKKSRKSRAFYKGRATIYFRNPVIVRSDAFTDVVILADLSLERGRTIGFVLESINADLETNDQTPAIKNRKIARQIIRNVRSRGSVYKVIRPRPPKHQ